MAVLGWIGPTGRLRGAAPDYDRDVAPLLGKYCAGCHNDDDREGGLSLESYASLLKGTRRGPAILAGDSEGSRLWRVMSGGAKPQMPPADEPQPTAEEAAVVRAWIAAGAVGPAGRSPDRLALIVPRIATGTDRRPATAVAVADRQLAVARFGAVAIHPLPAPSSDTGPRTGPRTGPEPVERLDLAAPVRRIEGLPGKVTAVHFAGERLVIASGVAGLGGVAELWDLASGQRLQRFEGHRDILYDAELSPDGQRLATCSYDRTIQLWDVASGRSLQTLSGHNGAVYDVAFSPDGRFLVSASADDTCKVWRVADGVRMDTLGQPLKEAYCCAFSPDGRWIVAGGADNNLRVWRFESQQGPGINPMVVARFAHEAPIVRLAYTADGSRLVSVSEDRTVKVWNTGDFSELQVFGDQPDVAMALAVAADGSRLYLGRMDGSLASYPLPTATASDRPTATEGVPVQETPVDGSMPLGKLVEMEPNDLPGQATAVQPPVEIEGVIAGAKPEANDRDLFRFTARAGEPWVIEVNAARSGSQLDSFIEVLDADGQRLERLWLQAVRDSYLTFRGKDDVTVDDFRVFNWQEMRLNEYLYANGEVVKLWLYPRGPDSGFMVYPGQGKRWGYFDTTPLAHALGEPCYVVRPYPPGTNLLPNGLPVFKLYYENDDEAQRTLGKDSKLYFVAPRNGDYLVRIKDVRDFSGPEFKYRLAIRPRRPDFRVRLEGANPQVQAGGGKEFKLKAERLDDYQGPIHVEIAGLPAGFTATTPIVIEAGQVEALAAIYASDDAAAPAADQAKSSRVSAWATIGGQRVTHDVNNLGQIKLGEATKLKVRVATGDPSQPSGEPGSGGGQAEDYPVVEVPAGETVMLKVQVERQGFEGNVPFGKEGSGRNLPFGAYIDNLGLNGLLVLEKQSEREFFLTVDRDVPPQERLFHLSTSAAGGQVSPPVRLRVLPARASEGR